MTLQPPDRKDSTTYSKKLIEVALPLKETNEQAARKKSIRHGHPSTLHLWWARPIAPNRGHCAKIRNPGANGDWQPTDSQALVRSPKRIKRAIQGAIRCRAQAARRIQ